MAGFANWKAFKKGFITLRPKSKPPNCWEDQIKKDTNLPMFREVRQHNDANNKIFNYSITTWCDSSKNTGTNIRIPEI